MASPAGNYALVPATSIEEARLIDFARAVWPKQAPDFPILTSWWRRAAPECAVAVVHQPSGAMAGICGGRPCEWTIDGTTVPAIGICDWFVAPAHEGKGLGRRLVRHFDAPDRFFYAFSISEAAKAYLKALGWDEPHSSSLMALPLPRFARVFFSGRGRPRLPGARPRLRRTARRPRRRSRRDRDRPRFHDLRSHAARRQGLGVAPVGLRQAALSLLARPRRGRPAARVCGGAADAARGGAG